MSLSTRTVITKVVRAMWSPLMNSLSQLKDVVHVAIIIISPSSVVDLTMNQSRTQAICERLRQNGGQTDKYQTG